MNIITFDGYDYYGSKYLHRFINSIKLTLNGIKYFYFEKPLPINKVGI